MSSSGSIGPPSSPEIASALRSPPAGKQVRERRFLGYRAGHARLRRRLGALIIDNLLIAPMLVPCALVMGGLGPQAGVLYLAPYVIYFFLLEAHSGQTVGKRLAGLRVVGVDGGPVDALAVGARNVLRFVDGIPGPPLVGALSMTLTGPRRRRIGDLAARTVVVEAQEHSFVRAPRSALLALYPILWLGMAVLAALATPEPASPGSGGYASAEVPAASDIAVSKGTIWVTNPAVGTVTRLDARTHRQIGEPIRIGGAPLDIVSTRDGAWFSDRRRGVVGHIIAGRKEPTVRLVGVGAGSGLFGVAVGFGSVWVTDEQHGTVIRIDPARHKRVGQAIQVGAAPHGVAVGAGSVWVANSGDNTVARIDPRTGRTTRIQIGTFCHDVTVGEGAAWVVSPAGNLLRVDASSNRVRGAPIPLGSGPTSAEMQGGSVWIANAGDGNVVRVDARTGKRVGRPIPVGGSLSDLGVNGDAVWALRDDGRAIRVQ